MSINQIAKELNVSKSTVSLVINGKAQQSRISKELEKRILDYVNEIGFKPNALAKSLATGKTLTIGLIVENIGDSFFGPIALRIEECLRSHGYHVLYSSTVGKAEIAREIIASMVDQKVEGLIISPTADLENEISKVLSSGIPLVVFDRKANLSEVNYVGTDNYLASEQAVKHLIEQGYSRIGMVTSDSQQSQMLERLAAYHTQLEQHDLPLHILSVPFSYHAEERVACIQNFLKENNLEAIYFSTNYLCISGIKAIQLSDKVTNYALLSFDDHEVYELFDPPITCIRQPIEEIAQRIVDNIMAQINGKVKQPTEAIIPSKLLIRKSTTTG
ncbi:LacI family transcriptional regulator [Sphingobacterium sp. lm-10]|uniref:LacI family DNA-binding transcriptional regulator n=1 Tax=Sphingobacterium sp. lm-10 TaxID=2944904 RepID=UPI0020212F72|nr:LacI family DNA-binding transcriptional regulator [Sphingobacterium sp. lm-10]MCL7986557.1 LacI family transcriptional regulator [Sphingobacterium sp. lm-10]